MIRLENVSKYYHSDGNVVLGLHKVNLELKMGEFVAITGESGSGKSTLLNVISGIDSYEDGEIYFNNEETSYFDESDWENYRKNYVGFVFQNYNLIDSYTVLENVETAMIINGVPKRARRKRAIEILKTVGLENHLNHKGTKLSGGEKQRLSIARAIAKDAPIIVADEPTGNLDSETGKQIMEILKELSKTKLVVMVTHNYELVENYVTRLVRIYDGTIVENKEIAKPTIEDEINVFNKEVPLLKKATPFAMWNFKNQPKITIMSLFVSLLITLVICFLFATYLESKVSSKIRYNHYFSMSPKERIIIKKRDKSIIGEEDYQKIMSLSNVDKIIKQDIIFSQNISLQQVPTKEDYRDYYSYFNGGIRHVDEVNEKELIAGRMPIADNEVLIKANKEEVTNYLNKTYFGELFVSERTIVMSEDLTIVGVLKHDVDYVYSQWVYFTDNMLTKLNEQTLTYLQFDFLSLNDLRISENYIFEVDSTLKNNEIGIIITYMFIDDYFKDTLAVGSVINFELGDYKKPFTVKQFKHEPESGLFYRPTAIIKISQSIYDEIFELNDTKNLQHTVMVKNYTQIDKTISELEKMGYYAFSPSNYVEENDLYTTITNVLLTVFYSALIFVIYLISYVIVRAIFSSRRRDQVILKSIGLDSKTVQTINIIQISIYFFISFIILIPTVIILSKNNVVLNMIFKSFRPQHYFLLLLINLALGVFIAKKINQSIQKKSILSSMKAE